MVEQGGGHPGGAGETGILEREPYGVAVSKPGWQETVLRRGPLAVMPDRHIRGEDLVAGLQHAADEVIVLAVHEVILVEETYLAENGGADHEEETVKAFRPGIPQFRRRGRREFPFPLPAEYLPEPHHAGGPVLPENGHGLLQPPGRDLDIAVKDGDELGLLLQRVPDPDVHRGRETALRFILQDQDRRELLPDEIRGPVRRPVLHQDSLESGVVGS